VSTRKQTTSPIRNEAVEPARLVRVVQVWIISQKLLAPIDGAQLRGIKSSRRRNQDQTGDEEGFRIVASITSTPPIDWAINAVGD
jgi:hypothetical protein